MGRMEAEQSEQGRGKKKKKKQKAGRLLQQQGRKSGQFLSLNESLLQENTQLYREATDWPWGTASSTSGPAPWRPTCTWSRRRTPASRTSCRP